ncbi:bifunctional DNA-formamidopyrimidine glycosylase/DNA-(apurinic or apyrimidinic site) lyase [Candidatus Nomurabacteria bacterium]|nr:bifunctional DNA-formamidopyrimidine glycosylase/DNA-(apurinic or apyrimidinic site) lyase [Candidatus Nomurabacteria bacterium]
MPELPEVETTTRGLQKETTGLKIKDIWTDLNTKDKRQKESIANAKYFPIFKKEIIGAKIISAERRAKNILINLSNKKTILIHMKMTGHLLYGKYHRVDEKWIPTDKNSPLNDPYNRFIHVVFTFSPQTGQATGKHLAFCDARKFGKIALLDTKTAHDTKHLKGIGPDPLDKNFNFKILKERLSKKTNGKIKTVLMDQSIIAGIGNIYSDEILWHVGIHPETKASNISDAKIKEMVIAMKELLKKGINFGGDSMSDYRNIYGLPGKFQLHHEAYRRTGEKCRMKNCKGLIMRKMINSRSGHFCSEHQI